LKVIGPGRLYNKLVKAGIGADHWQMHSTRDILVSRLLSKEARGIGAYGVGFRGKGLQVSGSGFRV
jgi:hypothetical protein